MGLCFGFWVAVFRWTWFPLVIDQTSWVSGPRPWPPCKCALIPLSWTWFWFRVTNAKMTNVEIASKKDKNNIVRRIRRPHHRAIYFNFDILFLINLVKNLWRTWWLQCQEILVFTTHNVENSQICDVFWSSSSKYFQKCNLSDNMPN